MPLFIDPDKPRPLPQAAALAADFTNATDTLNPTTLAFDVAAGRSYKITGCFSLGNSTPAEGAQFDFDGGTATVTNFWLAILGTAGTLTLGTPAATALNAALALSVATDPGYIDVEGYLECNAAGTVIIRFAEASVHASGTAVLHAGSWIKVEDVPTV